MEGTTKVEVIRDGEVRCQTVTASGTAYAVQRAEALFGTIESRLRQRIGWLGRSPGDDLPTLRALCICNGVWKLTLLF